MLSKIMFHVAIAIVIILMALDIWGFSQKHNNDYKTQSFRILAMGDHNQAVIRWIDGTLISVSIGGVKVDSDVTAIKGSELVIKYSELGGLADSDILEVKK